MLGWILGAVGIGGAGLALALIPGAAKAAVEALTTAWGWATKNPAAALCAVLLATTVWFWWGKRDAASERDAAIAGRASDNAICRKSVADLTGAIDDQNAAIAKLGADTLAKQKAAAIAVEAATAHGKVSEGYAARIDREPAVKGGPVCRSGAAVLDAAKAGEL